MCAARVWLQVFWLTIVPFRRRNLILFAMPVQPATSSIRLAGIVRTTPPDPQN